MADASSAPRLSLRFSPSLVAQRKSGRTDHVSACDMQSDKSPGDGGAAGPHGETAGQVAAAPPTHASQLDSSALTSTTASDRHADDTSTTAQPQGGADSLKRLGGATEGAGEGDVGPAEEGTPATTARPLAARVAVDLEQASINLTATRDAPPDAQSVAVPFQSVFAIPRPASLTSRITETTSNAASATDGERDSSAEQDPQMRAHIEKHLGVSTTTEQDHAHAHTPAHEQPPSGDSLLVLVSATRSVSAPVSGDDQNPQEAGEEQQWQQLKSRKRPRSAGIGGGGDDDGHETGQGSQVEAAFEPFPPGWHLEGASANVPGGDEAAASPSNSPEEGGEEDVEPASRRRRTEELGSDPVGRETPSTMQQLDQAHERWRQHREATLRSLPAQAMARNFTARHPPAAPPSAGPSLPPSYDSYSSIASAAEAYPYGGGSAPLLPPRAMMGSSTFSGRAGTTAATTSTQWYAKGSAAETYYVAHEQQRGQSSMQGHPPPPPPAAHESASASHIEAVAPRQARSIYDSPRPPHPYTSSSSSSYYYGGVPGYVFQSTPQQHQRYPSPFPGPPLPHQSGGYDASSPSTPAAASSTLSNTSGPKGEWSDHSSTANTTASTSVNTSFSSASLSRSAKVAETRDAIPLRAQSNLASSMHNAPPAPGSTSYSQGSEAPTPEPSSSVVVGTAQGQAESQDPTSPVASGSGGGGGTMSTTSASTGKKPSGRRPAPANAYSINSPFIYKLRWLLQNPQEVGDVITWSNDGSAVLVKVGGGNDAKLKQMLMRTFAHENPGAFTRQFAVYGFTQIKDPEELAEVLDPATQPADAWRAYEDESGTFHRDGLDDLEALKTMVAKKKGAGGSTTTTTTAAAAGRMMPAVQQRGQPSGAGIPVQAQGIGEGTVLPSIPGNATTPMTTTSAVGGTSYPTLQQGYWPPAMPTQSGHPHPASSSSSSSNYPQAGQQQQYYQQQSQASPSPSASASEYVHIAPKSVGQAQGQGQVQGEGGGGAAGGGSSRSRSKTEISLGGWFRQAADVPRVGGIEGLLRGPGALSTSTAAGAADDHQDGGAAGHVSGRAEEEEEAEGGSTAAE
ncbi:hypothetical protein B0A53_03652 [Rhodotorula sp. CCFEE 5036]|nr:hypothetical protein B0A53_03652 [Rhodotorula sp. CCFEE 5036]